MGLVRVINDDGQFHTELSAAGMKLVVVDFTASWCGPCQRIAPVFEELASKYTGATFLKLDVDKCSDTAAAQGVTAMPTFIFYRNRSKIDRLQGADAQALEGKIQQHIGSDADVSGDCSLQGHMDLNTFINKSQSECLNESDEHPFSHCLTNGGGFLQSDCDEQLILSVSFNQAVKLHSLKVSAPSDKGPKTIKLFINQPHTLDFDSADAIQPVQEVVLGGKDLEGDQVLLRYVKFQNVQNLQLFVKDNQSGSDVTQIDHLMLVGSPINTTNMSDFKRVTGKKGEAH